MLFMMRTMICGHARRPIPPSHYAFFKVVLVKQLIELGLGDLQEFLPTFVFH